jgi:hypothetical protein
MESAAGPSRKLINILSNVFRTHGYVSGNGLLTRALSLFKGASLPGAVDQRAPMPALLYGGGIQNWPYWKELRPHEQTEPFTSGAPKLVRTQVTRLM